MSLLLPTGEVILMFNKFVCVCTYSHAVNVVDSRGNTALHIAAQQGMLECMKTLLRNGTTIDIGVCVLSVCMCVHACVCLCMCVRAM